MGSAGIWKGFHPTSARIVIVLQRHACHLAFEVVLICQGVWGRVRACEEVDPFVIKGWKVGGWYWRRLHNMLVGRIANACPVIGEICGQHVVGKVYLGL